jgi:hypothetical protein
VSNSGAQRSQEGLTAMFDVQEVSDEPDFFGYGRAMMPLATIMSGGFHVEPSTTRVPSRHYVEGTEAHSNIM